MLIKTLLNRIEKFKSFVYGRVVLQIIEGIESVVIEVQARKNSRPLCSVCGLKRSIYDTLQSRLYEYVPLWGFKTFFRYAARRVHCPTDGVKVESLPWATGKDHQTTTLKVFLATWARRLSWKQVAEIFQTSWDSVFRAVEYAVQYGLAHRSLEGIERIGIDEIQVFRYHKYLTLVYQIDPQNRRLLWTGMERKAKTLLQFFRDFGKDRTARLKFICTDMWRAYLSVIRKKAPQALNVLDRFHIMKKFNMSIDQVRRQEVRKLKESGGKNVLIRSRWLLLKNKVNLDNDQVVRMAELLKTNLNSVRAYLMREDFQRFWSYKSATWAEKFLNDWNRRTMRCKIQPMKGVVRMLREFQPLILNWFRANGTLSAGIIEGLNLKAKLTMRKAYGFRSPQNLQIALYHTLGNLPEPKLTHKFC